MAVIVDRPFMEECLPGLIRFIEDKAWDDDFMHYLIAGPYYVRLEVRKGFLHEVVVFEDFIEYEADRHRRMSEAAQQSGISFN